MLLVADKEMFYARYYSPDIAGIESLAPPLLSEITLNNDPANLPAPFPFAFLVKNIHRAFNSSIESPGYDLIASALPVDSADNGAPFANVTIVSYFVSLLSRVFPTPSSSLPSVNNRNHFSRDTCNPDRSNNASDFNEQTPGISNFYIFRWDSISFSLSFSFKRFLFSSPPTVRYLSSPPTLLRRLRVPIRARRIRLCSGKNLPVYHATTFSLRSTTIFFIPHEYSWEKLISAFYRREADKSSA